LFRPKITHATRFRLAPLVLNFLHPADYGAVFLNIPRTWGKFEMVKIGPVEEDFSRIKVDAAQKKNGK
ncbi:MAG: hypothetical protein VB980_05670, partial [Opitutales bacterium]